MSGIIITQICVNVGDVGLNKTMSMNEYKVFYRITHAKFGASEQYCIVVSARNAETAISVLEKVHRKMYKSVEIIIKDIVKL